MAQDYNSTINLPKTKFDMRAGLPKKEPELLKDWAKNDLYNELIKHNAGKPKYILHDGPPYANGSIHMGTALNKIIKDIIVRQKNMAGFEAPYVPGYDAHGLPIELKALKKAGELEGDVSKLQMRSLCREFATEHIDIMNEQFARLGIIGDFEHPYLTLVPSYVARQIEIFGEMADKGYIYKGMKAVYWCPEDKTALAEAEIEYSEDECDSVYVRFAVTDDPNGVLAARGIPADKAWFAIWTTTTWTLPANVAVCLNADFEYVFVKIGDDYHVFAKELVEKAMEGCGITDYEIVGESVLGRELELMQLQHPFLDRKSLVILGDHVTLDGGTGCVHTAPGHGVEDFEVCAKFYPHIPVIVPVDNGGYLTEQAGPFAGLKVWDANKVIENSLRESGNLLGVVHLSHQYPHCWRCHNPIIFRATEQWFCRIDAFKEDVFKAIESVNWFPAWGEGRMHSMVADRSDWCLSRQRIWGVPIPAFYCTKCAKYHVGGETTKAVADWFRKEGSDSWYKYEASELLPAGYTCECGGTEFTKDEDIMDVWFDSGSSHAAVLDERPELQYPADLYMEGSDQYRGWFQSSLLTSVATRGQAPYKNVLSHGWVVDGEGKQMHKSAGNGIEPIEIIKDFGADIVRLWVASTDYTADIRISKEIVKQLSEAYRKIRNTARFMLANTSDFDPATDMVADSELLELDRWALATVDDLSKTVLDAYDRFDFHKVYHSVYKFCVVDMSNFYLDVLKDRLYINKANSSLRRAAQTAMFRILTDITKMLAPILVFTTQEIWSFLPEFEGKNKYVSFEEMSKPGVWTQGDAFNAKWNQIIAIRDDVKKVLEQARADKVIGSSLEANVTLHCTADVLAFIKAIPTHELEDLLIVSKVNVLEDDGGTKGEVEGLGVSAVRVEGEKCERCWKYSGDVGTHSQHSTLCVRCADILQE